VVTQALATVAAEVSTVWVSNVQTHSDKVSEPATEVAPVGHAVGAILTIPLS